MLELAVEALDDCNALGELGTLGKDQRAQRADVIRQSIGRGRHGAMKGKIPQRFPTLNAYTERKRVVRAAALA